MAGQSKKFSRKSSIKRVWHDTQWTVGKGRLIPGPGRPKKQGHLFTVVGEKIPIESLNSVEKSLKERKLSREGVYIAHDSMGYARYVGRGRIFSRLRSRARQNKLEIKYYSFYVVAKAHEREIETLLIRAAAPMLFFNERKKRLNLSPGNIRDYEPDTEFYERQYKKGRVVKRRKRSE